MTFLTYRIKEKIRGSHKAPTPTLTADLALDPLVLSNLQTKQALVPRPVVRPVSD